MPISALDVRTIKLITTTQIITTVYAAAKELIENALDADADNIEINLVRNSLFDVQNVDVRDIDVSFAKNISSSVHVVFRF